MWQELPLSRGDRFPRWSRYGQMLKMLHRVEIEPAITRYLFFLRGCDWALPKSFVPTPCRHTRSDRENQPPIFRLPPWRIYITMLVWSILLDSRRCSSFTNFELSSSLQPFYIPFGKARLSKFLLFQKILLFFRIFDSCLHSLFRENSRNINNSRFGKKILEDILTKKPSKRRRGGCGTRPQRMRRDVVRTRPLDERAKGAREASMERRWTKRAKRGKGASRTGGGEGATLGSLTHI